MPHVRHASIGDFDSVSINQLGEGVARRKASVNSSQEFRPNVGGYIGGVWGVEPSDFSLSGIFLVDVVSYGFKFHFKVIATVFKGILVRGDGILKNVFIC